MKNQQRIMTSLRFLQQYLDEIEQIVPATYDEYMQSLIIRRSSERQIQIIIEQVSDICALLCREVFSGIPGDDASILDILSETCLSLEMCEKIRGMKGFRNILVHGYTKLDNAKVFSHICAGKTDIYQFIEEVTTFLNISDNQKM